MSQTQPALDAGTGSADYAAAYYHSQLGPPYEYDEPHWQDFFGGIATAIVRILRPATLYDAGCAKGFLVRALAEQGVDARGGDISEFAIADAPPDLAPRLEVRDLTTPFIEKYDVITCIEVLEHMAPAAAKIAIANLCAATDVVILSSTTDDFAESTHINVRQPAAWAQDFAVNGFFRRTDLDASFVSPWAVILQRGSPGTVELVARYEALLAPLIREADTKRRALLQARRELDEATAPVYAERDKLTAEVTQLRERSDPAAELTARATRLAIVDELLALRGEVARLRSEAAVGLADTERAGLQATVASLSEDLGRAREQLLAAEESLSDRNQMVQAQAAAIWAERDRQIEEFKQATTWRVGRTVLAPLMSARRLARRAWR